MLLVPSFAPGIAYLDGPRLHRAPAAGIGRVLEHREEFNCSNVIPVADTGPGSLAVQPYEPPQDAPGS